MKSTPIGGRSGTRRGQKREPPQKKKRVVKQITDSHTPTSPNAARTDTDSRYFYGQRRENYLLGQLRVLRPEHYRICAIALRPRSRPSCDVGSTRSYDYEYCTYEYLVWAECSGHRVPSVQWPSVRGSPPIPAITNKAMRSSGHRHPQRVCLPRTSPKLPLLTNCAPQLRRAVWCTHTMTHHLCITSTHPCAPQRSTHPLHLLAYARRAGRAHTHIHTCPRPTTASTVPLEHGFLNYIYRAHTGGSGGRGRSGILRALP